MNTVFVMDQPYPMGMACTKRMHFYAKALVQVGQDVEMLIPKPKLRLKSRAVPVIGIYEKVPYRIFAKSSVRSSHFIRRRVTDFIGPIRCAFYVCKRKPKNVLMVTGNLFQTVLIKIAAKFIGAKVYRERSEVDFYHKEKINGVEKRFLRIIYSWFDGIIVISETLEDFLKKDLKIKCRTTIIPILNEKLKEDSATIKKLPNTLLYTGSLQDRKDGIKSILESVAKVKNEFPEVKLYITGNAKNSNEYDEIIQFIHHLDIKENIEFTGYIQQLELERLMESVSVLILVKPKNRQNKYNFPTKLGEYLESGTPVLMTKCNAAKKYLKNNEDLYIVDLDINEIADKIMFILKNPEEAAKIGKNGIKASGQFNYQNYSENLKKFLNNEY